MPRRTNISGIELSASTHRIKPGGRIHHLLFRGVILFDTILPRKEIRGTRYSSRHVAQAEILGLIERMPPHEHFAQHYGSSMKYQVTELGVNAFWMLQKIYDGNTNVNSQKQEVAVQRALGTLNMKFEQSSEYLSVQIPVKISKAAWDYHKDKIW